MVCVWFRTTWSTTFCVIFGTLTTFSTIWIFGTCDQGVDTLPSRLRLAHRLHKVSGPSIG